MTGKTAEMSTRDIRAHLADAVNTAIRGQTTYITSRGRRVAAIVPLSVAENAERQAEGDSNELTSP